MNPRFTIFTVSIALVIGVTTEAEPQAVVTQNPLANNAALVYWQAFAEMPDLDDEKQQPCPSNEKRSTERTCHGAQYEEKSGENARTHPNKHRYWPPKTEQQQEANGDRSNRYFHSRILSGWFQSLMYARIGERGKIRACGRSSASATSITRNRNAPV